MIQEMYSDLHARHLHLYVNVPVSTPTDELRIISANSDGVVLMNYDEHEVESQPGPIASQDWFIANLTRVLNSKAVPLDKLICAVANYGYDWEMSIPDPKARDPKQRKPRVVDTEEMTHVSDVWQRASDADADLDLDYNSLNPHYEYIDEDTHTRHVVWFLDGVTLLNEMRAARGLGLQTFALWRLGSEDRAMWSNANDELIRTDRELEKRLRARFDAQTLLLSTKHKDSDARSISEEISALMKEQDDLRTRIRSKNRKFLELTQPPLLTAPEIQKQLDSDTLLIEFALGDKRSYVWAVSPSSIKGLELPSRDRIEPIAQRLTEALTAPNREVKNETPSVRRARSIRAETDYGEAISALSKLLIDPIASELGQKRLVVVADGALQLVPFGALQLSSGAQLIAEHEIVSLPSASVLALQRRELANRKEAPGAIAVLADPVFDAEDIRVAQAKKESKAGSKTGDSGKKELTDSVASSSAGSPTQDTSFASARRDVGLEEPPTSIAVVPMLFLPSLKTTLSLAK